MPYNFEIQKEDGYLLLTVSGILESADDITLYANDIVECTRKAGCNRILLDERAASSKADQYNWMLYADRWISDRPARSGLRIAAVYSSADAKRLHWIETILQNRSFIYKIFGEMSEARQWLMF